MSGDQGGPIQVVSSAETMSSISADSSRVSSDVAGAISEVASGATSQAAEIETSVDNVKQLTDRITKTADKTKELLEKAEAMKELAESGIEAINDLNAKNEQTNKITTDVVEKINELNKYVKSIDKITLVLRNIAEQTNLLSLNAAIEAAGQEKLARALRWLRMKYGSLQNSRTGTRGYQGSSIPYTSRHRAHRAGRHRRYHNGTEQQGGAYDRAVLKDKRHHGGNDREYSDNRRNDRRYEYLQGKRC